MTSASSFLVSNSFLLAGLTKAIFVIHMASTAVPAYGDALLTSGGRVIHASMPFFFKLSKVGPNMSTSTFIPMFKPFPLNFSCIFLAPSENLALALPLLTSSANVFHHGRLACTAPSRASVALPAACLLAAAPPALPGWLIRTCVFADSFPLDASACCSVGRFVVRPLVLVPFSVARVGFPSSALGCACFSCPPRSRLLCALSLPSCTAFRNLFQASMHVFVGWCWVHPSPWFRAWDSDPSHCPRRRTQREGIHPPLSKGRDPKGDG